MAGRNEVNYDPPFSERCLTSHYLQSSCLPTQAADQANCALPPATALGRQAEDASAHQAEELVAPALPAEVVG